MATITPSLEEIVGPIAVGFLFGLGKPLALDSSDLASKFGFGDGDLLCDYAKQVAKQPVVAAEADEEGLDSLSHRILVHLVDGLIVRPLAAEGTVLNVSFFGTGHNPARLRSVNGLLDAKAPGYVAEVTPEVLIAVTLAVLKGEPRWKPEPYPARDSAQSGLAGLLDRDVEIDVGTEDPILGKLVGAGEDFVTLFSEQYDGCVIVVPMANIRCVRSFSFSEADDAHYDDAFS